jgi:hypothetical protein
MKNYKPTSMSFAEGFLGPKGDVGFVMRYDNDKATQIINEMMGSGRSIVRAEAGLDGDWAVNSSVIFTSEDGFIEPDFYDHSIWATPVVVVTFSDGNTEGFESWKQ